MDLLQHQIIKFFKHFLFNNKIFSSDCCVVLHNKRLLRFFTSLHHLCFSPSLYFFRDIDGVSADKNLKALDLLGRTSCL